MSSPNSPANTPSSAQGNAPDLTTQAKELGREISGKASDMAGTVVQAAKEQASQLGNKAKEVMGEARDKAEHAIADHKSTGADYIGSIAQSVQRAAGEFEESVPLAAQYIRQAADQLGGVADAVRQRDVRELVSEVQDFARRQPALFFGGAMLLGFVAMRFLKSADPAPTHNSDSSDAEGFASHDRSYH